MKRSRTTATQTGIPVDKLRKTWEAIDNLFQSVLQKDRQQTLQHLVRQVGELLAAEACALFIPVEKMADELVLEASWTKVQGANFNKGKRIKIASVRNGGLTSHVADYKEFTNYNMDQLAACEYSLGPNHHHDHLLTGKGYAYLGIPLLDRHRNLLGVITVDNKLSPDGTNDENLRFDAEDEEICTILSHKAAFVIEHLRRFDAIRGIVEDTHSIQNLNTLLHSILQRTLTLLHADRGDLALYDPITERLEVAAVHGNFTTRTLEIGKVVPEPSFMYATWQSPEGALVTGDVSEMAGNYYESHPDTISEIALRFELKNDPIGVINAESTRPNAFDQQDKEVLILVANCVAAVAVRLAGEQHQLLALTTRVLEFSSKSHAILNDILETVKRMFRVDCGIIYIADHERKLLRCDAVMGCPNAVDPMSFFFRFGDDSIATMVLKNRTSFFYPDADDPQISQRGRTVFDIHGPIVGVPLMFDSNRVVGVLIVWSRHFPAPSRELKERLKPIAALAASKIAMWESEDSRQRAQNDLRVSEAEYRSLVELLPDYILRKDKDLRFTYANRHACQLLGKEQEDIIGRDDSAFYPHELAAKYQADDRQVIESRKPIIDQQEPHFVPAKNSMITVRFSKVPILGNDGSVGGVQTVFRDISKQLEEEQNRNALEERWRILVEMCPDSVLLLRGWNVIVANNSAELLFGVARGTLLGKPIGSTIESDKRTIRLLIEDLLEDEALQSVEISFRTPARERIMVEMSARRLCHGASEEVLLILHDIGNRKRMLDFVDRAERLAESRQSLRKTVFISYSRVDEARVGELRQWLEQLKGVGIDLWIDADLEPGKRWRHEIETALETCQAAILLVSNSFLTSRFITQLELPRLLLAAQDRDLPICPVLVTRIPPDSPLHELNWLCSSPLQGMSPVQRGNVWEDVYAFITDALRNNDLSDRVDAQ